MNPDSEHEWQIKKEDIQGQGTHVQYTCIFTIHFYVRQ